MARAWFGVQPLANSLVFIGTQLVSVDEGCPVGTHAGGQGFDVEGICVFGIALKSGICKTLGLVGSVVKTPFEVGIDLGTLAVR